MNSIVDFKKLFSDTKFEDRGSTWGFARKSDYKNVQDSQWQKKKLDYIPGQDKYTDSRWCLLFVWNIFTCNMYLKTLDIPVLVSLLLYCYFSCWSSRYTVGMWHLLKEEDMNQKKSLSHHNQLLKEKKQRSHTFYKLDN